MYFAGMDGAFFNISVMIDFGERWGLRGVIVTTGHYGGAMGTMGHSGRRTNR